MCICTQKEGSACSSWAPPSESLFCVNLQHHLPHSPYLPGFLHFTHGVLAAFTVCSPDFTPWLAPGLTPRGTARDYFYMIRPLILVSRNEPCLDCLCDCNITRSQPTAIPWTAMWFHSPAGFWGETLGFTVNTEGEVLTFPPPQQLPLIYSCV